MGFWKAELDTRVNISASMRQQKRVGKWSPTPKVKGQNILRSDIGLTKYLFHRRKIYTEEKAKVVTAAWGIELIQFLVALASVPQAAATTFVFSSV